MARNGYAPRQDAIFLFIVEYKRENNGFSPTYQEIADHFEMASRKNAYNLVLCLVRKRRLHLDERSRIIVPEGQFVLKTQLALL